MKFTKGGVLASILVGIIAVHWVMPETKTVHKDRVKSIYIKQPAETKTIYSELTHDCIRLQEELVLASKYSALLTQAAGQMQFAADALAKARASRDMSFLVGVQNKISSSKLIVDRTAIQLQMQIRTIDNLEEACREN